MQRSGNTMIFAQTDYAKQKTREFDSSNLKGKLVTHLEACYKACGSPQGVDLVRWVVAFVKLFIVQGDESLKTTVMAHSILTLLPESTRYSKTVFTQSAELHAVMPDEEILTVISKTHANFQAAAAEAVMATYSDHASIQIVMRDLHHATFDVRRLASFVLMYYLLLKKTKCFGQKWQITCVNQQKKGYVGNLEIPLLEHVVAAFTPLEVLDSEDEQPAPKKPRFVRDDTVF